MDLKKRGVRLLAKLTGDAFEKMENAKASDLKYDDGVERFKKYESVVLSCVSKRCTRRSH